MNKVYSPAEDSYFFADFLENYLSDKSRQIKIFDMGSGSGIQAQTCKKLGFNRILAADINKKAVENLKKQGFNSIYSDLFLNINKKEKFDLIIFNAPYLPEHKYDKEKDTTGGKRGDEISVRFIKQAKKQLKKDGKILLLISSLTPMKNLKKFKPKIVSRKKLFIEELRILEFK
jgi:HemK-related putative methylase